jgi:hypothetical protein
VPATARILHLQAAPGSDKLPEDSPVLGVSVSAQCSPLECEGGENTRWRSRVVDPPGSRERR